MGILLNARSRFYVIKYERSAEERISFSRKKYRPPFFECTTITITITTSPPSPARTIAIGHLRHIFTTKRNKFTNNYHNVKQLHALPPQRHPSLPPSPKECSVAERPPGPPPHPSSHPLPPPKGKRGNANGTSHVFSPVKVLLLEGGLLAPQHLGAHGLHEQLRTV